MERVELYVLGGIEVLIWGGVGGLESHTSGEFKWSLLSALIIGLIVLWAILILVACSSD
ncbi:TPA_asm: hypothetical protein [Altiarchaeum virus]|nr:TPA_asm: hypothetical protein [Altiarchaeum virus]